MWSTPKAAVEMMGFGWRQPSTLWSSGLKTPSSSSSARRRSSIEWGDWLYLAGKGQLMSLQVAHLIQIYLFKSFILDCCSKYPSLFYLSCQTKLHFLVVSCQAGFWPGRWIYYQKKQIYWEKNPKYILGKKLNRLKKEKNWVGKKILVDLR